MDPVCYIDLSNLIHNYRQIRNILKPGTKLMGVVKANAYGHGAIRVASILQAEGIDSLSVALVSEAKKLRQNGITIPILVFGRTAGSEFEEVFENELDLTLFDLEQAVRLNMEAKDHKIIQNVYIKFDTGMGRLGMVADDYISIIKKISELSNIQIKGIYSHFSSADSDEEYTKEQFFKFRTIIENIRKIGIDIKCNHICNSAATLQYPDMHLDMVRVGLSLYGLYPSEKSKKNRAVDLREVMSIKTGIAQIKKIAKPSYISYGNTYMAKKEEIICTIPIGYADGIQRNLSNKFEVLIEGKRQKAVGTVCMDHFMVSCDVMPNPYAEVILVGLQGSESISIDELCKKSRYYKQ